MKGEHKQEKPQICRFLLHGNCRYGTGGKNKGGCAFHHPKICKKYLIHGWNRTYGCPSWKLCGLLHQKDCEDEKRNKICRNKLCQFRHTLDSEPTQSQSDRNDQSKSSGGYWIQGRWRKDTTYESRLNNQRKGPSTAICPSSPLPIVSTKHKKLYTKENFRLSLILIQKLSSQLSSVEQNTSCKFINRQIDELKKELECPVCLEVAKSPIYKCEDDHLVCSNCKTKMSRCPVCRIRYPKGEPKRFRGAERSSEKLTKLYLELAAVKE